MNFPQIITKWYHKNKRDLPWRNTKNPYFIWLSEIMLQQTRVAQGLPYYYSFTSAFPTVFDLANASEESVLKLWQGLGYYSRARNLHHTAKFIAFELNGVFPNNYKDLMNLKGVGEYTAAAVASFAFNEVVPVVDGNVFRVLSRYFNIETDIASSGGKKEFSEIAFALILKNNPALFNQAIMEFGALQCVPKNPNCEICVLNSSCLALQKKKVSELPLKIKKLKIKTRFFNYLIFKDELEKTIIQKRIGKGIWQNLYEFPLLETSKEIGFDLITDQIQSQSFIKNKILSISEYHLETKIHKLTHQHLHIKFWGVMVKGEIENGIEHDAMLTYPFPIVIFNFITNEW